MKCPNCGRDNDDRLKFCTICGTMLREDEKPNKGTKTASVLSAILHALFYIFILLAVQIGVTSVYMTSLLAGEIGNISADSLMSQELITRLTEQVLEKTVELTMLSYLITILIISLSFSLRRKNPLTQMGFRPVNPLKYPLFALLGAALNIFVSVTVSILPLPGGLLDSLENQYSSLSGSGNLALEFLSISVVAGITEEIVYRGLVNSRLSRGLGRVGVIIISSLLFGLAHMTPIAIVYASLIGVLFSLLYERYNSIKPSMICHIFFNGTSLLLGDVTGAVLWILYAVSAVVTVWCIYKIFLRKPTLFDYLVDFSGEYKIKTDEERALIDEANRLRENRTLRPSDMERLSDKWDELHGIEVRKKGRKNTGIDNDNDNNNNDTNNNNGDKI